MIKEIWKDIPGYEGLYKVSNIGNVKSLARLVVNNKGFRNIPNKILNPGIDTAGYSRLNLSINSNVKTFRVHVLVAMSFLQYKPSYGKLVCDHIDENKLNNNLSNLQIISIGDNIRKNRLFKRSKISKL